MSFVRRWFGRTKKARSVSRRLARRRLLSAGLESLETRSLLAGDVVSTAVDSSTAAGDSLYEAMSADGRYIVFQSSAANLVPNDTNNASDIFMADTQTNLITLVSTNSAGIQGNHDSYVPAMSADGRYVVFSSASTNLVGGDTNGVIDMFVKDMQTGVVTRVSTNSAGVQANHYSERPAISANGRYITFSSPATNLVPNDTNGYFDVFLKDMETGACTLMSTNTAGARGNGDSLAPGISADGRFVVFHSRASNLVDGDTNQTVDIFVKNIETGDLTRVNTSSSGEQANSYSARAALSGGGRYVAFMSYATNLVPGDKNGTDDVFVKDLKTGETKAISVNAAGEFGNEGSAKPILTPDGRFVAFFSNATNLVPGDTNNYQDVFLKDLETGSLRRVSTGTYGSQGNDASGQPVMTDDGRFVAFMSPATTLVPNDNNDGAFDIFFKDMQTGELRPISTPAAFQLSSLAKVTPDPRNTAVSSIDVTFYGAIDPNTFTIDDLSLTRNGGDNLITSDVTITALSDTKFRIEGLAPITAAAGKYRLTVSSGGVKSTAGAWGLNTLSEEWTVDVTAPSLQSIVAVKPMPGKPVGTVDLFFSEAVDLSTFNYQNITLTRDGGENLITPAVKVTRIAGSQYRISNLQVLTRVGGVYRITVDSTGVRDLAGNVAAGEIISSSWRGTDVSTANENPQIYLGGSVPFAEPAKPMRIAAGAAVIDNDTPVFNGGKVIVSMVDGQADESLRVIYTGTGPGQISVWQNGVMYEGKYIGTFSGGQGNSPLFVSLGANATVEAVQALVANIGYFKTGEVLKNEVRTVQFVLKDGEGGTSLTASKDISLVPVNDRPQITAPSPVEYSLNKAGALIAPNAVIYDPDSPMFHYTSSPRIMIVGGADGTERLELGGPFQVVGRDVILNGKVIAVLAAGAGESGIPFSMRFNADPPQELVEKVVRSVTFRTVGSSSLATRRISIYIRDRDYATDEIFVDMKMTTQNAAPTLALSGQANYTENDEPVVLAPLAGVSDPDDLNFAGGTLTVTNTTGAQAADQIGIKHVGGGSGEIGVFGSAVTYGGVQIGSFTGGNGTTPLVISLNGSATVTATQALLRSITFATAGENPVAGYRTLTFQLNDGLGGLSNIPTKLVRVFAVNDAPSISMQLSKNYTAGTAPVLLSPGSELTDPDSAYFTGGTLTVAIGNADAGDRVQIQSVGGGAGQISVTNGNEVRYEGVLIGTFTGGSGTTPLVVTFNGKATRVAARAVVRAIAFSTEAADAQRGLRNVSFVITDGDGGTSDPAIKPVYVVAP